MMSIIQLPDISTKPNNDEPLEPTSMNRLDNVRQTHETRVPTMWDSPEKHLLIIPSFWLACDVIFLMCVWGNRVS